MRKSKRKEQLEKTAPKEIRETDNVYLLIVVISSMDKNTKKNITISIIAMVLSIIAIILALIG